MLMVSLHPYLGLLYACAYVGWRYYHDVEPPPSVHPAHALYLHHAASVESLGGVTSTPETSANHMTVATVGTNLHFATHISSGPCTWTVNANLPPVAGAPVSILEGSNAVRYGLLSVAPVNDNQAIMSVVNIAPSSLVPQPGENPPLAGGAGGNVSLAGENPPLAGGAGTNPYVASDSTVITGAYAMASVPPVMAGTTFYCRSS